ncbi:hypothetical protein TNCV_867041 [Trichonephila clavipes]|nr:hypothetical protein TNCV_867041 [Trichonephila clavipes]
MKEGLIASSCECPKCNDRHDVTGPAIKRFLRNCTSHAECRKVHSGYLPFRTNASTLPITPRRSSSRDVGTSSNKYHTITYSPTTDSANERYHIRGEN